MPSRSQRNRKAQQRHKKPQAKASIPKPPLSKRAGLIQIGKRLWKKLRSSRAARSLRDFLRAFFGTPVRFFVSCIGLFGSFVTLWIFFDPVISILPAQFASPNPMTVRFSVTVESYLPLWNVNCIAGFKDGDMTAPDRAIEEIQEFEPMWTSEIYPHAPITIYTEGAAPRPGFELNNPILEVRVTLSITPLIHPQFVYDRRFRGIRGSDGNYTWYPEGPVVRIKEKDRPPNWGI